MAEEFSFRYQTYAHIFRNIGIKVRFMAEQFSFRCLTYTGFKILFAFKVGFMAEGRVLF